jgi:peptidoglycan/LPS O-acetylase OafA/YrhL
VPLLQFIPLFMAGTIFYKIYIEKTKLPLYYCIVTCCLICQMALFNFAGQTRYFITFNEYCLMLVLFFILFIFFVNNKLKFIVNKISLFFGKISFALYLTHQYISLTFIIPYFIDTLHINFWIATIFINLPIVVCIASFITFKIEIPYSKKMKKGLHNLYTKIAFFSEVSKV